jgi:4-hydroxybenzoate polyprenyltransferase
MIQRKQTVFLLLAAILLTVTTFTVPSMLLSVVAAVAAITAIMTIFDFKCRKRQAAVCLAIIIGLLVWYILLAAMPQIDGTPIYKEWPSVLPMISVILTFMARKGILDDEKLVRSLDRIR